MCHLRHVVQFENQLLYSTNIKRLTLVFYLGRFKRRYFSVAVDDRDCYVDVPLLPCGFIQNHVADCDVNCVRIVAETTQADQVLH
ncbi:hypothetical protein WT56_22035 [Burkholderia pseudomultivorans]|uniref:Uncharacterized protein n=1 Tax=Burkholderia pseudomultivorans TaxID=1207504 RepID=A0A132ECA8_9BURK|nr:hypothetical protein WT56_22035 [Burkholderia pseudomultivorans]